MKLFCLKAIVVSFSLLLGLPQLCLAMVDEVQVEQANREIYKNQPLPVSKEVNASSVYVVLDKTCKTYADSVYRALAPSVLSLFSAFALVALIWNVLIKGLLQKRFDGGAAAKLLLTFSILAFFIKNDKVFFEYFYEPIKSMTLEVAVVMAAKSPSRFGTGEPSILNLLNTVDQSFSEIHRHAWALMGHSFYNIATIINGLFLHIVYDLIAFLFVFYIADLSFGLMAVTALSPLYLAGYFFETTKGYSQAAIRLAVCSCLTVIFAAMSIGVSLTIVRQYLPSSADAAKSFDWTGSTWPLLCVGFLCVMFLRRSPQLASSITGASDSGTAIMTAGVAMTVVKAAKAIGTAGVSKLMAAHKAVDLVSNAGGSK